MPTKTEQPATIEPSATITSQAGEPSVSVIDVTSMPTETTTPTQYIPSATQELTQLTPIVVQQPTLATETTLQADPAINEKDFPNSLVQIDLPGIMAKVISPIEVKVGVKPGDKNLVSVQLYGEDGRLMADQLLHMVTTDTGWVNLSTEIPFELKAAAEVGLIVVSTRDEYGRRIAQSSTPVIMMQIGENAKEPTGFNGQAYVVQSYNQNAIVKNGVIHLTGYAHPFNDNPVIIELITQTGGVMQMTTVKLPKIAAEQDYAPFSVDIPYSVTARTQVRLTMRQRSEYLQAQDVALSSHILYLDP